MTAILLVAMSQTVTAKLDNDQVEYLQELVDRGHADSISEAVRNEVDAEWVPWNTPLRKWARVFANVTGLFGLLWLTLTMAFPLGFRVWAFPFLAMSVGLFGFDRVLAYVEPGVSRRLFGRIGGESA